MAGQYGPVPSNEQTHYPLATWLHHPCPLLFCLSVTLRVLGACQDSPCRMHTTARIPPLVEEGVQMFPRCNVRYSEYNPCEDVQRSLRFNRNRLIYRERHCPRKHDLLKCRVPAPFGYKRPFRWPTSRDFVWYANMPHKHLTVEKAVQNWIHYQGDRFKFPGGGTMFPNGANAYIDHIEKSINLQDGSIRTATDTGCGVASWGACLLSCDILTVSFAPCDTHEAQVQFALEQGVPALIGVLASKRLPYLPELSTWPIALVALSPGAISGV